MKSALRWLWICALVAVAGLAYAQTPAGTRIENTATLRFQDHTGAPVTLASNAGHRPRSLSASSGSSRTGPPVGGPVAGAAVAVRDAASGTEMARGATGPDGAYSLLLPGPARTR
jgi:hypothetical protein